MQNQRGAGFCVGVLLQKQEDGWSVFYRAAKAKPGVQRDLAHGAAGNIAGIDSDHAEAAGLDEQVCGAQGLIEVVAADPEEFAENDSGGLSGERIEAVTRIDQSADFTGSGALSKSSNEQAGAAGAGCAADFSQGAARQTAGQRVDFSIAGGDQLESVAIAISEGRRDATAEISFDLGSKSRNGASSHGGMGGEKGGGRGKILRFSFA